MRGRPKIFIGKDREIRNLQLRKQLKGLEDYAAKEHKRQRVRSQVKAKKDSNVVKPKRTKKINKKFTIEHFSPIIDTPEGQIKMGTETIMFTPAKRH